MRRVLIINIIDVLEFLDCIIDFFFFLGLGMIFIFF